MLESLISLILATTALLGSPGPATLALAGVGASCGIKKGLPFLCGILAGLLMVIIATALGLAAMLKQFPTVRMAIQIIGGLYICMIAIKLVMSPVSGSANVESVSAPKVIDGFILNVLNPKAYLAFAALFSQFSLPTSSPVISIVLTAALCFAVAVVIDLLWLIFGGTIRSIWNDPRYARMMRVIFALLMVVAIAWTLMKA